MKKIFFHVTFILIALVILTMTFVFSVAAETYSGECGEKVTWLLDTVSGVLEISGTGEMIDCSYSNPAPWESYRSYVKTLTISDNVTNIGRYMFFDCSSLVSVKISSNVSSIGSNAFENCSSLTEMYVNDNSENKEAEFIIPDSVTSIGEYAFSNCDSVTSVTIGKGITSIDLAAVFSECDGLKRIAIGENVTKIDIINFGYSLTLKEINVEDSNKYYCDIDGVLFNKNKTSLLLYPCGREETEYIIPDSVKSINYLAFYICSNLNSLIVGDGVTDIGDMSIWYCPNLESVILGNSVTSIGTFAFEGCKKLTRVVIPDSVKSIEDCAFSECYGLISATIPDSVKTIGSGTFSGCKSLEAVYINRESYAETWLIENDLEEKIKYPVTLNKSRVSLHIGVSETLSVTLVGDYLDDTAVIWTSDNELLATVDNGTVLAIVAGKTKIKATTADGMFYDSCEVVSIPKTNDNFMAFEGYQTRNEKYNGLRSRFVVNFENMPTLEADGFEVIEYGTILASTEKLTENGDDFTVFKNDSGVYDTLSYGKLIPIMKNGSFVGKYISKNSEQLIFACTVTNFSESNFDKEVSIRGYAVLSDADGNEYVVYCDYPSEDYRSVSLAMICDALAARGEITEENNISYAHVIQFRKEQETNDFRDNEIK